MLAILCAIPAFLFGSDIAVAGAARQTYSVASGTLELRGGGWGHGRGMSQWGAYQAAVEGRDFAEILAFYYPGTTLMAVPGKRVRVLLSRDTGPDLVVRHVAGLLIRHAGAKDGAALTVPANCSVVPTAWRAVVSGGGLAVQAKCGSWRETIAATVAGPTVSFEVPGALLPVINGSDRRGYRGIVRAERVDSGTRVVNEVGLEEYLRSVVAAEVSASWPAAALAAQAVAARTYAAFESAERSRAPFDVYDSVRSQAYPGAVAYRTDWSTMRYREDPRTDAAITATADLQLRHAGQPVLAQFSSSNGGYTAAATGVAYLRAAPDDWDSRAARNPNRSWTVMVDVAALARRYGLGSLTAVVVTGREGGGAWGGRVTSAELVGTHRTVTLSSDSAIRTAFGVRSSNFTIVS